MDVEIGQVLTQIFAFLIMLAILKRFAWKPILDVMEMRKETIKAELKSIEQQKLELKYLTSDYQKKLDNLEEEAQAKLQESVQQGQKIARQIQEQTHEQAKEILQNARNEVTREVEKAKIQLKDDLVKMTMAATEKMLKESLDLDKQKKLLEEVIDQLEIKS